MTSALAPVVGHADARPMWAEIDLDAITHNVELIRANAGRAVKLLMPVKANAYGHGVVEVSRHLQRLGVDGLATANVDDAIAARRAGVTLPILLYGAQLPSGNLFLHQHGLTPTVYDHLGLQAVAALGSATNPVRIHVKVDAGMGRLGVRIDECAAFVGEVMATPGVHLEGIYTHIPFSDSAGEAWSRRRLQAFADMVRFVELEHGITIDFAQAAASSVFSRGLPDGLNTISPGHLTFGLHPLAGARAEALGFRKALRSLRAQVIHVGRRRVGDDLPGCGPAGLDRQATVGVILFGMDNGYRQGGAGDAFVLCHGQRCKVLGVSAEYTVIDVTELADVAVGDVVTVVGSDGDDEIAVEDVAAHVGAPSAAYWMVGLKNVPYRYRGG
ncbi:MAG: alanine racemase [Ilumatobacteraceae bacterium]